jgi:hypothetical protein
LTYDFTKAIQIDLERRSLAKALLSSLVFESSKSKRFTLVGERKGTGFFGKSVPLRKLMD